MSELRLVLMLGAIATFNNSLNLPSFAHKVEISENVGATLHIEPNDTPRAGELTQIWFALTKEGGKVIPLDKCDCKLSIYTVPRSPQSNLQQATLKPLSAEGYKNIPSAKVTFPKIGRYDLEITGKPINGGDFKPFKLTFKVTVTSRAHNLFRSDTRIWEAEILERLEREIGQTKERYPEAKYVGIADGAETNWKFLNQHTQTQILDFYHASGYLGAVAEVLYLNQPAEQKEWLKQSCHDLKQAEGTAKKLHAQC